MYRRTYFSTFPLLVLAGRRAAGVLPVLLGMTLVVFLTVKLVPGDPVRNFLGPAATPETVRAMRSRLGLDDSLLVQYARWLGSALHGDLGTSIARQKPVSEVVVPAFGNTLLLAGCSALVVLVGGAALGAVIGLAPVDAVRRTARGLASLAVAAPQYVLALVLVLTFAVTLKWLPVSGMTNAFGGGSVADRAAHLVLPAIASSLVPLGITARVFGASVASVAQAGFVENLRARGLSELAVTRHVLNCAVPSLLTIGGVQIAYLLEGVVFVEAIFAWPGIGQTLFDAIAQRDLPVIQAGVLLTAAAFVGVTAAVDVVHLAVDPRLRTSPR